MDTKSTYSSDNYGVVDLSQIITKEIFKANIIDKIVYKFTFEYKEKGTHSDKKDLSKLLVKNPIENICVSESYRYVYLLYLNEEENSVYVGKAKDIKKRISSHLIKQYKKTSSKIEKVYESLKDDKHTFVHVAILQINEPKLYSAIEGLLIDYYNAIEQWNERDD